MSLLQQQQSESRELIHSLQSELHVYDRVVSSTKANKGQSVRLFYILVLKFKCPAIYLLFRINIAPLAPSIGRVAKYLIGIVDILSIYTF